MGLDEFQSEITSLTGVQRATKKYPIEGGEVVQVEFKGEPADYLSQTSTIRDACDVKRASPDGLPRKNSDGLPFLYYEEQ